MQFMIQPRSRRLFLASAAALLRPLAAASAGSPLLRFDRALFDFRRMAGPYGAGRIRILLEGGAITSGAEGVSLNRIDFVRLRANGAPAFGPTQRGRWVLAAGEEAPIEPENGLRLDIYLQEIDEIAKIAQIADMSGGSLRLEGVVRLVGERGESYREFQADPIPYEINAAGQGRAASIAGRMALAELQERIEEARAWQDRLWRRTAPAVVVIDDESENRARLGLAVSSGRIWTSDAESEGFAWLRGDRERDAEWRTFPPGVPVEKLSDFVVATDRAFQAGTPALAAPPPDGYSQAAVFRGFHAPNGETFLEARYLRARRREGRLEIFPEVDEHSLGSPLVLRNGVAGIVTGLSEAVPFARISA